MPCLAYAGEARRSSESGERRSKGNHGESEEHFGAVSLDADALSWVKSES